jgi:xylulose-5-phosphate/fructose-6-phosphate phosphoketolase
MTPVSTEVKRKTGDASKAAEAGPLSAEELRKIHAYVCKYADDMPDIAGWRWGQGQPAGPRATSTEGDNV